MGEVYKIRKDDKIEEVANNQSASEAEASGDLDRAITLYEKNIKKGLPDSFPFDRLLIIYRKQKRYKDELRVINKGIEVFSQQIEKKQQQLLKNSSNKSQLKRLSNLFGKKVGLVNKKGDDLYMPAPVSRWLKRKEVVKKKLKKV
jgi:tetratricopeptide (TPR) repeat protein